MKNKRTKNFNHKSIFYRYMTTSIITFLIPLIIFSTGILLYTNYTLSEDLKEQEMTVNEKVAELFDDVVADANAAYFTLLRDTSVQKFINADQHSELYRYDYGQTPQSLIQNLLLSYDDLAAIYIYNHELGYAKGNIQSNFLTNFIDSSWYETLKQSQYKDYLAFQEAQLDSNKEPSVVICKTSYLHKEFVGCYIFIIPSSVINEKFKTILDIEKILITDDNDNVIFCSSSAFVKDRQNESIAEFKKSTTLSKSSFGFNVYTSVTHNNRSYSLTFFASFVFILFFLCLTCAVLTFYNSSKDTYRSITNVVELLLNNETGCYDTEENDMHGFSSGINIEQELFNRFALLKTYHIKALHAQINPHFLNNTLSLIELLALKESNASSKLYTLTRLFSKYLKNLSNINEYIIPLSREFQNIKDYIDILNIKYDNIFDLEINAESDVLNLCATHFMLQPIVENAIIHGILESDKGHGLIIIDAFTENDFLIVQIKNNGKVIEPDKLTQMQFDLRSNTPPTSDHIGLLNVNQRLKLIFGSDSSCKVDCNYNENITTFTLSVPAQTFNSEQK